MRDEEMEVVKRERMMLVKGSTARGACFPMSVGSPSGGLEENRGGRLENGILW